MAISGKTGIVVFTAGSLCATSWDVNFDVERLDASTFCSDGWKEYIAGLKGATGSVTSLEWRAIDPSTLSLVTLTNDDVVFSGSAFLNTAVTSPVEGRVEYTYDIQFSGEITVT